MNGRIGLVLCRYLKPIPSRNAMGAPGLAFETWDPPRKGQSPPSSISGYFLFIRAKPRVRSFTDPFWIPGKAAPGLAFETWDPSNQVPLETLTVCYPGQATCPWRARGKLRQE